MDHLKASSRKIKDDIDYQIVKEGLATIRVPKSAVKAGSDQDANCGQSVFYNPIQQFNRDLSVLVIHEFARALTAARGERANKTREKKAAKTGKKRKRDDIEGQDEKYITQATESKNETSGFKAARLEGPGSKSGHEGGSRTEAVQYQNHVQPASSVTFTILDALAATGLRAIRYAKEIPLATSITANDLSSTATEAIKLNVQDNEVWRKVKVNTGNAIHHMFSTTFGQGKPRYDVIDLDPYGTAAPFFDTAVQALNDGGLLCATCTDPGVFASIAYPEKCFALYGGVPLKGAHSHEAGLRIILHAIATSAARYGLAIEPMLSLSIDYYTRVFVRVWRSPAHVKFLAGKSMLVYNCGHGCGAWTTQLLVRNREIQDRKGNRIYKHSLAQGPSVSEFCEHCGSKTHVRSDCSSSFVNGAQLISV